MGERMGERFGSERGPTTAITVHLPQETFRNLKRLSGGQPAELAEKLIQEGIQSLLRIEKEYSDLLPPPRVQE